MVGCLSSNEMLSFTFVAVLTLTLTLSRQLSIRLRNKYHQTCFQKLKIFLANETNIDSMYQDIVAAVNNADSNTDLELNSVFAIYLTFEQAVVFVEKCIYCNYAIFISALRNKNMITSTFYCHL